MVRGEAWRGWVLPFGAASQPPIVIPAKAGIAGRKRLAPWPEIPAFAGMTKMV